MQAKNVHLLVENKDYVHSFIQQILSIYYVPVSLLSTRDIAVSRIQDKCSSEAYIPILIQSRSKSRCYLLCQKAELCIFTNSSIESTLTQQN